MKFLILKASDDNFHEEREINTIEDLKALEEIHPGWENNGGYKDFIISFDNNKTFATIMIYDDWIE